MWSHPESLEIPIPFQGDLRSGFLSVTDSVLEVLHKPKACSWGPVPQVIKYVLPEGREEFRGHQGSQTCHKNNVYMITMNNNNSQLLLWDSVSSHPRCWTLAY